MVDDLVEVVGIAVMLHPLDHFFVIIFIQPSNELGDTGVDQLHSAQLSDIGFQHHGVHPADPAVNLHHLGSFRRQILDAAMIQIHTVGALVCLAYNGFTENRKKNSR